MENKHFCWLGVFLQKLSLCELSVDDDIKEACLRTNLYLFPPDAYSMKYENNEACHSGCLYWDYCYSKLVCYKFFNHVIDVSGLLRKSSVKFKW